MERLAGAGVTWLAAGPREQWTAAGSREGKKEGKETTQKQKYRCKGREGSEGWNVKTHNHGQQSAPRKGERTRTTQKQGLTGKGREERQERKVKNAKAWTAVGSTEGKGMMERRSPKQR